ncbi:MAG: hypothetical protein H0W84_00700 [Bacteroidetes bacterium]|nr:hypothetical protein [Bacteroidota bacterium]
MITRRIFIIITLIVRGLISNAQTSEAFLSDDLIKKPGNFFHFASDKISEEGNYDVYKINAGYAYSEAIVIKGNFKITGYADKNQARITVFNAANDLLVGIYNTNPTTGKYIVILVPNVKYIFQVEVPGFESCRQMEEVP